MLMLAGLMGMALLGTLAVFAVPEGEEETEGAQMGAADTADSLDTSLVSGAEDIGSAPVLGTPLTDLLGGGAADDFIEGLRGDDELLGGAGADTILGGAGNDTLHGEAGADVLRGGEGDDQLFAHGGGDTLDGGAGDDEAQGGLGADLLLGGPGRDALLGREGADTLIGGDGVDTLFGGGGNDLLSGVTPGEGATDTDVTDYLNGGSGKDALWIGRGDMASGGADEDDFYLGDWIGGGEAAELVDFDPVQDRLIVVWSGDAAPTLDLRASEEAPGMTEIRADGELLALLPEADAPGLESIALLEASRAGPIGA